MTVTEFWVLLGICCIIAGLCVWVFDHVRGYNGNLYLHYNPESDRITRLEARVSALERRKGKVDDQG